MKPTEKLVVRELNRLSEEVFRLYYLGKYQDAIKRATFVLLRAKEKLGQWHANLPIYADNLQLVKHAQKMFESGQLANNSSIEQQKAFQQAVTTLGRNHPYVNQLKEELVIPDRENEGALSSKRTPFNKYIKRLVIIASLIVTIFIILIVSLLNKYLIFPDFKLNAIHRFFQNPFAENYNYTITESSLINAPLILQYPELPRGCEVTSLAMLLNYAGKDVSKLTLAEKIKKDPTPLNVVDGKSYYGNPDYGFVGNMYSLKEPGLGVYHEPIKELAENYLPNQIIDLTGRGFEDLFYFLSNDIPVWVITNTQFTKLDVKDFQIWYTTYGPIQITYKQHSVLLTGYDENYIYFNDPLVNKKNRRVPKEQFKEAWEQMGRQAISYIPKNRDLIEILPID